MVKKLPQEFFLIVISFQDSELNQQPLFPEMRIYCLDTSQKLILYFCLEVFFIERPSLLNVCIYFLEHFFPVEKCLSFPLQMSSYYAVLRVKHGHAHIYVCVSLYVTM